MSIEAHNYVIKLKVGNLTAKFVLGRLADRADERFSCYPTIGLIAAEVEKSERTVQRALEFLMELRLVSDRPAFRSDGSQTSNRYFLHGPWDDYAGTGVPFPEIVTPKEVRASMWAQAPAEAEFRAGSAAAVALAADTEALEASRAAAEAAAARAAAAKDAQRERGRKAAAAKPYGMTSGPANGQVAGISAAQYGVTSMSPSPLTCMSPPGASPMSPLEPSVTTHSSDEAVSPRSGGDVRRTSTSGSSEIDVEGGCAASSKTSPSSPQHDDTDRPARGQKSGSNKAKHTREQLTLVAAVRAHFPAEFLGGLPDVPTLSQAVLDALAGDVPAADRTVEQLGARIQQRWNHHGWASKYYAGQIDSLVGAAVAMVRPLKSGDRYGCANPRCEAGVDVDTKEDCHTCPARFEDRRAERRQQGAQSPGSSTPGSTAVAQTAMPAQRVAVAEWWDCRTCDASGKGAPPADGICRTCRDSRDTNATPPPF
jgi:hypothetical protein